MRTAAAAPKAAAGGCGLRSGDAAVPGLYAVVTCNDSQRRRCRRPASGSSRNWYAEEERRASASTMRTAATVRRSRRGGRGRRVVLRRGSKISSSRRDVRPLQVGDEALLRLKSSSCGCSWLAARDLPAVCSSRKGPLAVRIQGGVLQTFARRGGIDDDNKRFYDESDTKRSLCSSRRRLPRRRAKRRISFRVSQEARCETRSLCCGARKKG